MLFNSYSLTQAIAAANMYIKTILIARFTSFYAGRFQTSNKLSQLFQHVKDA